MPLDLSSVGGILPRGGTILRTSRTNPAKKPDGLDKCIATLEKHNIDALIAIGGDDTLSVAQKLHEKGVKVVGVPKTIDNDLAGTDYTFGFDTAVNVVTEAIDRVHTTAEAHNRVMVVEVMGRNAGWIAIHSGVAPSAFDRVLATRYGLGAIDMVHRGEFGCMAALRGNKIVSIPLADAIANNRTVDQEMIDVAAGIMDKLTGEEEPVEK